MTVAGQGPGCWAIVTRGEPQAGEWVSKLRAQGLPAEALPLLAITPAPDPAAVRLALSALQPGDLAMFVSPNAAAACFEALGAGWVWPQGVWAAGTGPGTAAVLRRHGVPEDRLVTPAADAAQLDSEALWQQLRRLDWAGRQACIVRGDGGRDWLAATLQQAGARVGFVQAYGRTLPQWSAAQRHLLERGVADPAHARWLLSSSEALDHLAVLAPGVDWSAAQALASHPRIAERARQAGFGRVLQIQPSVAAVLAACGQGERPPQAGPTAGPPEAAA